MNTKIFASMLAALLLAGCFFSITKIKTPTYEQTAYEWKWVDDFEAAKRVVMPYP